MLLVVDPLASLVRAERDDYRIVYDAIRAWLPYSWESKPQKTEDRLEDNTFTEEYIDFMIESGEITEDGCYIDPPVVHKLPAVLALHHACKEREMRMDSVSRYLGSVAWGAAVDCVVDLSPATAKDESNVRKLEIGKSRFDGCPANTTSWLEWVDVPMQGIHRIGRGDSGYGYMRSTGPAPKLKPPKTDSLQVRVTKHLALNPSATKASVCRAMGLDPSNRHSASYKVIAAMFDPPCKPDAEAC